jgi:phosphatidylserine/phosphatidylglycerophosphate/cardiolipin synthase-like enzyme
VAETEGRDALIIAPGPADELETGSLYFCNAIGAARRRVWIASPYLVPDVDIQTALILAAIRGVDVRILVTKLNGRDRTDKNKTPAPCFQGSLHQITRADHVRPDNCTCLRFAERDHGRIVDEDIHAMQGPGICFRLQQISMHPLDAVQRLDTQERPALRADKDAHIGVGVVIVNRLHDILPKETKSAGDEVCGHG